MEVIHVSSCNIKPHTITQESQKPYYLTPWDLAMLSVNYIQKGLLFTKPPHLSTQTILDHLKNSLSQTLTHFFPLAGRFTTHKTTNPSTYTVFINTIDSPGAEFIYATLDLTISNIISPESDYVPEFVNSLFAFEENINHDGHSMPLLAVKVTEFVDGVFLGLSMNHSVGDGRSFWHFFSMWSDLSLKNNISLTNLPITERLFLNNHGPVINLPFSHHNEFLERYTPPAFTERIFHFSGESIRLLKAKAHSESNTVEISSFQALSALLWRSITRARDMPDDKKTSCRLAIDNRSRLEPPVSKNYFGNCIQTVRGTTTAGELLSESLGWAAKLLHQAVVEHGDKEVRTFVEEWVRVPLVYQYGRFFDADSIMMGSSPRFDMYDNDFGWGKPVAIRSGFGSKFDGKVSSYPGCEGGGSVDLEVCLPAKSMRALLLDEEFMAAVSFQ